MTLPPQTTREVLIAAKAKINTPQKWIRREYHKRGRYCAAGACDAVAPDKTAAVLAQGALDRVTDCGIENFNDQHTHAEVMAAFDRAIEEAS